MAGSVNIRAELNYLRLAPRKVRLVANAIRGKRVAEAERVLAFLARRSAGPLLKLLRSAVANARHNFQITDTDSLRIAELRVDQGPTLKRFQPRARGRAAPIRKRTSHVRLVLEAAAAVPPTPARGERIRVVPGEEAAPVGGGAPKSGREREAFRVRPLRPGRPADIVRRMFRRKAI